MKDSKLPTEVELVYEIMPCSAMRCAQEPNSQPHSCNYFRRWGLYHSYDYNADGPPPQSGISHPSEYVGLANLTPEALSGCRKAPIFVVGINPNLPGYAKTRKNSAYPLFDDYKQFAHYFRYRSIDKLEITEASFKAYGGYNAETPPDLATDLNVPLNNGKKTIPLEKQLVTYYNELQKLLNDLAANMGWNNQQLSVGEDIAYGNMVACPSARWLTAQSAGYPDKLVMSADERKEIIQECFYERKYFLRQLFQSLPKVIMVVGATTARPFITAMQNRFIAGNPLPGESVTELVKRKHILKYGDLPDGTVLTARVIFSGHITGDPATYQAVRAKILEQLTDEAKKGNLVFNANSGHFSRPPGACVFCPMLEIGKCDYENELIPISGHPTLTADSSTMHLQQEKFVQYNLMEQQAESASTADDWEENTTDYKE
jgi:hypothetical protein